MTAIPFELFGEQYYLRQGFWMLCLPVLAWLLLMSPWTVLKHAEGRMERAIARAKKIGRLLVLTGALYIAQGMLDRAFAAKCSVRSWSPDGLYALEICLMGGSVDFDIEGLVRLRSTKDGALLAEDEFHDPSFTNIFWDDKQVIVGASSGAAFIDLPPTWLDRLRAKLP
ncbi:hypothetical protein QTH90_12360 [Variovorax sp. J2P1-59]|uniref:hypothetical protein n=1 Tax=Variovorax flavidus TaxID=3053501 RepID=UPI0025762AFD|nr:hypothetical protein [Variovorax sp. J2P1-59]MDM0075182.1 hypothetical protein [Variovorax sp. J2P1-59]